MWMKAEKRPEDGFKHYSCVLLHADNALAIHHDAANEIKNINQFFPMKNDSIGPPSICLG